MLKKVLLWVTMLFLAAVILGSIGMSIAPHFGWHFSILRGGSMEPAIDIGSVAVIQPVEAQTIAVGDIIEFAPPSATNGTTIHRVVEVVDEGGSLQFRTKGDANETADPYLVPAQNVEGGVWLCVPYLGHIIDDIRTPLGRALLFGIPAFLIILLELKSIFSVARDWRLRIGG